MVICIRSVRPSGNVDLRKVRHIGTVVGVGACKEICHDDDCRKKALYLIARKMHFYNNLHLTIHCNTNPLSSWNPLKITPHHKYMQ